MINIHQQITFLPTNKFTEMEAFYSGLLSLKKVLDQGDCIIFKTTDSSYIGFCERELELGSNRIILTLVTDQVDEFYEQLQKKSVQCESKPCLNEKYAIYHFFVKDPNGYLVEIQQFVKGFDGQ
ncbi:MAG: glyoxalase [Anaerolineaceae bacterium]|nr:glyoxalase [Anaerolineaceae bacterium]